jgi:hypothetical protein
MIKTRLDSRSKGNQAFDIVCSTTGEIIATVALDSPNSATLSIDSANGTFIAKPNGWTSKRD